MNESSVTARLFALIKKMSEDEQLTLLKELEERLFKELEGLFKGRRKLERMPFFMVIDYSTEDRFYKDYIQNISTSGVFIKSRVPFTVGQEVSLTFPLPDYQKYIEITGEVARVAPQGIGVKFKMVNQDQEAMIESLFTQTYHLTT